MTGFLLLLGFGGLVLSLLGTACMRTVSSRIGLVDRPEGRKDHAAPTPLGGGVAIYLAFWLPVWVGIIVAAVVRGGRSPAWMPTRLVELASGVAHVQWRLVAIFAGTTIIAATGLVDDRWGLPAWPRLAVQVAVALGMFLVGVRVTVFHENVWMSALITVAWFVVLTNAFNWLDNMDALAGGISLIVSAIFLTVAIQTGQLFLGTALALLIGVLAGFLVFNWPPAGIFMGDCGAMQLGVLLAALSAEFTFYQGAESRPLFPVIVPLLIFAVPLFDMASVIFIRLHQGRPIHLGDHSHFSHRLVSLGMTPSQAVLTVYLVTLALGLGATGLYYSTTAGAIVTLAQALALIAIILVLERAAKKEK